MVPDYSDFPNFCCLCLRPDPGGTWHVVHKSRRFENYPVYQESTVRFNVPMCRACRWKRRCLRWLAIGLSLFIGLVTMIAFAVLVKNSGGKNGILVPASGPIGAAIAGLCLWHALKLSSVHIAVTNWEGTWFQFGNPIYQKLYTGEHKIGRQVEQDALPWR
jgi:hypothetical protein